MRIIGLHILARDLEAQRRFYVDTLGFALESSTAIEFTVLAGASRLRFIDQTAARSAFGPYHFAFNIPFDQVDVAKAWAAARVPLIADNAGQTDFPSELFASRQIYFFDPDGNIVEFIGRQRQPASDGVEFTARDSVHGISEIGVAVPDVPDAVRGFLATFGNSRFGPNPGPDFAAVGDDDGMLIVVREGRTWFPDTGIPAGPLWFEAEVRNANGLWRLIGPTARIDPVVVGASDGDTRL